MCLRIVLVLRRRFVVTVVEKGIIKIDACVHRSFQDRKRMPYWSQNQVKSSSENNADPTSSADESMGL